MVLFLSFVLSVCLSFSFCQPSFCLDMTLYCQHWTAGPHHLAAACHSASRQQTTYLISLPVCGMSPVSLQQISYLVSSPLRYLTWSHHLSVILPGLLTFLLSYLLSKPACDLSPCQLAASCLPGLITFLLSYLVSSPFCYLTWPHHLPVTCPLAS